MNILRQFGRNLQFQCIINNYYYNKNNRNLIIIIFTLIKHYENYNNIIVIITISFIITINTLKHEVNLAQTDQECFIKLFGNYYNNCYYYYYVFLLIIVAGVFVTVQ